MTTASHRHRGLPFLLAALSSIGPFSVDAYLPSFANIGESLHADPVAVQHTLAVYLAAFAFMTLWHGALSDALGRRRVMLAGLLIYTVASLGCALSPRIEWLWAFRILQGLSAGVGMVVSRALIRDLYEGAEAQRLMSQVAIMFGVAPAVAPIFGGFLQAWFGWTAVFYFLFILGIALSLACWHFLPETLPPGARQNLVPHQLAAAYWQTFVHPQFRRLCLALAALFLGFFIYVLSAPVFLMQHLGVGPTGFYWLFIPSVSGMMAGSWLSARAASRWSTRRTLLTALACMGTSALGNLLLNIVLPPGLPWSILPIPLHTFGMSLAVPTLTLLALDCFPDRRGLAASVQGFVQTAANALFSALIVPLLWGSTLLLAAGHACLFLLGLLLVQLAIPVFGRHAIRH
jgi:MFS transporter, DHA1 family, multidrug resistance protein